MHSPPWSGAGNEVIAQDRLYLSLGQLTGAREIVPR
jgi:hypothetical protein